MTIHANKSDEATLLYLWDEILLESDPCFHYFIDLELLMFYKEDILKKSSEELPQYLVNITIEDKDHCRKLVQNARGTLQNTPHSFRELLSKCSKHQIAVDSELYVRLERLPCLSIECKELIGHCYADALLAQVTNEQTTTTTTMTTSSSSSSSNDTHKKSGPLHALKHNKLIHKAIKNMPPNEPPPSVPNSNTHQRTKSTNATTHNDKQKSHNDMDIHDNGDPHRDDNNNDNNDNDNDNGNGNDNDTDNEKNEKRPICAKFYAEQRHLKFFIIDCRPKEQFEAGHLPCAFHLDPTL
ncbi:hypothetical protein RFI_10681, partial [Reticulomyxa filosa]